LERESVVKVLGLMIQKLNLLSIPKLKVFMEGGFPETLFQKGVFKQRRV